ncbi:cytochrome c biogenesis protein CcdA [Microbacterium sp. NPDC077391]|uniref:cytochrome c biogenesis CcdA family protein n=1 Tax=unclassified Microbacterium TaxID=2609290 RepID=UPI000E856BBB|nr:cytochrome c biogenesis protein CcdA [Microbacterium sp. UBA1097]HAJ17030.1 cytochrome C biogenesis protein [Microbacterium sp.]HBS75033.1 cytochrome C biogenesis protein [Microbacterium sp.]HBU43435.1 cytochrome C biogenesis protein [Microbacterium sp.]HCM50074.1 cytochrome C biogenesis protein [Microbacterium sp.]|tara:strand:- start:37773 stop:38537 length:765 start_codon:yes stop_codon:yes gene_type:complete
MNPGDLVADGALWVAIPIAVLAGLISFVSPCVLPLVPGYLGYLGGASSATAVGGASTRTATAERTRLLLGVTLFIAGFTVVFVTVTILGGTFGLLLLQYANVLTRVFGVVVIILGLVFIGFFGVAQRTVRPRMQSRAGLLGAPLLGFALGVGWTPCIGPTLAAILSVSWNLGDPARAGLLGLAYSLGLGLPFLVLALGWGWASRSVAFLRRHIRTLNIVGGGVLVLLGVLMVTGLWTALMSALQQVVINVPLPL